MPSRPEAPYHAGGRLQIDLADRDRHGTAWTTRPGARRHGERGISPLSALNRERLLKDLDARAKGGDVAAAVGIAQVAEQTAREEQR